MTHMIRKAVYVKPEQEEWLAAFANEFGVSESVVVRKCIDLIDREVLRKCFRDQSWEDERRFIEQRMAMDVPQTGRSWMRDELYEERIERVS